MRQVLISIIAIIATLPVALRAQHQQVALIDPASARPPGPGLLVRPDAKKPSKPLRLERIDIDVVVHGFIARTSTTMTFRNDTNRPLEGELYFPIPTGATVSGYALDIEGRMREAVIVEKREARYIFEREQRKGIDPGLVEWTKGNNFKTRVWPIPAKGTRTIRVDHVSEVVSLPGEGKSAYTVPLQFGSVVDEIDLTIETVATGTPQLRGLRLKDLSFAQVESRFTAHTVLKEAKPLGELVIVLPNAGAQVNAPKLLVERSVDANDHHFVLDSHPVPPAINRPVAKPKHIGLYWDASHSRAKTDKSAEYQFIEKLVKQLDRVQIGVVIFRDKMDAPTPKVFNIKAGDARELIRYLKRVEYDGGTNLGSLIMPADTHGFFSRDTIVTSKLRPPGKYGYHLLFTDGLTNLGDDLPMPIHPTRPIAIDSGIQRQAVVAGAPVFTFTSDSSANHALLRLIAESCGGASFTLTKAKGDTANAIIGLMAHLPASIFRFIKAEYDPAAIDDLYPKPGTQVDGRFTLAGRLKADEATITLHFGYDANETVTVKQTIRKVDAHATTLVGRLWAQKKLDRLAVFPDKHHGELVKLGRRFNLVTPSTSMLVLESVEQYVEYGIVPPKRDKVLSAKFTKLIEQREIKRKKSREQKLQSVLAMWNDRVKWWGTSFRYPENFRVSGKGTSAEVRRLTSRLRDLESRAQRITGMERERIHSQMAELQGQIRRMRERDGRRPGAIAGLADNAAPAPAEDPTSPAPRPPRTPAPLRGNARAEESPADTARAFSVAQNSAASGRSDGEAAKSDESIRGTKTAGISIKAWDPKTPYLEAMKDAGAEHAYDAYIDARHKHGDSPAFYLDCANYLFSINQDGLAIRVLSNILELKLDDAALLRVVAHKLQQERHIDLAVELFERVRAMRPEEPQSHRDLALALAARDSVHVARVGRDNAAPTPDLIRAIALLNDVVMGEWDDRFPRIELIALMEANHLIAAMKRRPSNGTPEIVLDSRLRRLLDVDVRIVLTWDADLTDIDLWVTEPSGEKCDYSHPATTIGGRMSKDFTQGYGPEEYIIKRAMPGKYRIAANFYGSSQQKLTGATTVQATVITNFGRPNEQRKNITIRLTKQKEVIEFGNIVFDVPAK